MPEVAIRFAINAGDVCDPSRSLDNLAMFSALMQSLRTQNPASSFTIIGGQRRSIVVPSVGHTPFVQAWHGAAGTRAFDELIRQHHALFVMGGRICCRHSIGHCNTGNSYMYAIHRSASLTRSSGLRAARPCYHRVHAFAYCLTGKRHPYIVDYLPGQVRMPLQHFGLSLQHITTPIRCR